MGIKSSIKHIATEMHPFVLRKRSIMRKTLKNTTPTLLCPNCLGGILFHDLGLQFRSPTVNTMMFQTDFVKFVLNLDHYLNQKLLFFKHSEYTFPCACLDDIVIHFTHYHTEAEAEQKWEERKQRIDLGNLFICLAEKDGLDQDTIRKLAEIPARGLVVFTATDMDLPYTLQIEKYKEHGEVGNILSYSYITGKREYEQYFDFVKWFNEANGADFSISRFQK